MSEVLERFYSRVLPESGHYCLFLLASKKHVWADSVSQLTAITEHRAPTVQGVYFGTASYIAPATRTQANVFALRSLRLDLDAGEAKHAKHPEGTYPTQRDALAGIIAFSKASGIAPSYLVSSGEGLHVYYCLDEDLSPAEWKPLAVALGRLCETHGLKADTTVTTDTARILRPPGTLHPNGERVRILKDTGVTYSAGELREKLGDVPRVAPDDLLPALSARTNKYDLSVNSDVVTTVGPPKSVAKIIKNCPAMAEVARVRGDVQEPLWRAMLGVVKFTVEGVDAAHELSNGHDGYDHDATERKFNAWTAGPTTCAEFGRNTTACGSCVHRGKIKSPVMLGLMTAEAIEALPPEKQATLAPPVENKSTGEPWDGFLPDKFSVVRDHRGPQLFYKLQVEKEDETGQLVPIIVNVPFTRDIFWLASWAEAAHDDDNAQIIVRRYDSQTKLVTEFTLDQSLTAGRFDLLKFLASKGIGYGRHKKAPQAMEDYVHLSLEAIKAMSRRPKITGRFGIRVMADGQLAAAHGSRLIRADGTVSEGMLSEDLRDSAASFEVALPDSPNGEWDGSVWTDVKARAQKYAAFMRASYAHAGAEPFALAAMLTLASPLMPFATGAYTKGLAVPPNGLTVSLFSRQGGKGKTALAQAVMLAYGNPAALVKDGGTNGATEIAKVSKLSTWGTMPMSLEEMGNNKEQSASNLISSIANGTGRERGKQRGGFTSSPTWALVALMTTNRAQRDMVAATAEESSAIQYRMLELNVENVEFTPEQRVAYAHGWAEVQRDCQGAMGAMIHHLICQRGAATVNKEMLAFVARASDLLDAKQDARFQYRALGALLYLQTLLAKEGLGMFDPKALIETFRTAFDAGLTYVQDNILPSNGVDLLSMALNDLRPETLITYAETNRGYEKDKFDLPLNERMPVEVSARHIKSMGWTYLKAAALRKWAIEHKVSDRDVTIAAKAAGILMPPNPAQPTKFTSQMDLFKGTREATSDRVACYKINTRKLAQLLGDEDEPAPDNVVPLRTQEGSDDGLGQDRVSLTSADQPHV